MTSPQDSRSTDRTDNVLLVGEGAAEALGLALPGAGLLGLVLKKIAVNRARRQAELLDSLEQALNDVTDRLDGEFVESDEFEALVEQVVEKGAQRKELEKRGYYGALLASAALSERPDSNDLERMVDTIGRLRKSHMWLLAALLGEYTWPQDHGMPSNFEHEFSQAIGDVDLARVKLDWADMVAAGLVTGYPGGTMSQGGARNFRGYVTDFGRRFHQFVVLPYQDVHPPTT